MAGPLYLETVDRLIRSINDQFKGSLKSGTWFIDEHSIQTTSTIRNDAAETLYSELDSAFITAVRMFGVIDSRSFRSMSGACIRKLEKAMSLNYPRTWRSFMQITRYALIYGRIKAAQLLFRCSARFISATSHQRYTLQHTVENMSLLLSETDPEQLWQATKVVRQSNINMLIRFAGPRHWSAVEAELHQMEAFGDLISQDRDRAIFKRLISDHDDHYGRNDWRPYNLRWSFAGYLQYSIGDIVEAVGLYNYIIDHGELIPKERAAGCLSACYSHRSLCHETAGNIAMANLDLRQAIGIRQTEYGHGSVLTVELLVELEKMLLRHGLDMAGAETREERLEIVENLAKKDRRVKVR